VIEPILKKNGIPNDFKYLALIESGLENVTSPAGAKGFWQFLKGTAKDYGLEVNNEVDERYNAEKATQAACEYFNKAHENIKTGLWLLRLLMPEIKESTGKLKTKIIIIILYCLQMKPKDMFSGYLP